MAYIRQPSSDGAGASYIRVLIDGLGTNQIAELKIHCSNGQSYNASVEGGTTGNYRSTTQTFTGLSSGTQYGFWGTGRTSGGTAINVPTSYFSTVYVPPPDPEPAITALTVTASGSIKASWSVSNADYMRTSSSMRVYLSGPNNTTMHDQGYLSSSTREWEKSRDGAGNELVVGASYTIWIYVYNRGGASFGVDRSVTFSRPRPTNFAWTNSKSSGSSYNLTSSEWRRLLDTINLFRAYKKLVTRDFNHSVSSGAISGYVVPSASSFNAARNAINDMSPSTSVPSAVSSGGRIYASDLNRLVSSLNSIT